MTIADLPVATVYVVVEWVIRIVKLAAVPFRRTPESARAWLLLVLFLPIPGVLLYALIGRPGYPSRRRQRLAGAAALLETATEEIAHSRHCRQPRLPDNFRQAEMLIEKLGRFPALGSNGTELIADYEGVISRLVADIDAAQDHVHLLMYIFTDDRTGELVMQALVRASARGVTCRVLIDAFGSRRWARRIVRRLSKANIAEALPVHPRRRGSARADLRNHRKIAVIDGIIGYVGSQNIVNKDAAKGFVNEEMVVRVNGPAVVEMQAVFAVDW
jgi:cardiolipin synthase